MMGPFSKLVARQRAGEFTLGNPLRDWGATERRLNYFFTLTGGRGFRSPPKTPRTDSQGMTRGDRRRARRAQLAALVSEDRPRKHMHSFARRVAEAMDELAA